MQRRRLPPQVGNRLGAGRTAEIFAWGEDAVLKLFRAGWPATLADQEARHSRLVHAAGLPVPRVLDEVGIDGRRGVLFERVVGRSLLQELSAQPWRVGAVAREIADLHLAITSAMPAGLDSLADRLRQTLHDAPALPPRVRAAALARLDAAPADQARLCHGDFHPDNVIRTDRGLVVIDWLTAGLADPAYDVARSRLLATIGTPTQPLSTLQRALIAAFRQQFARAYVRHYCRRHGWPATAINDWELVAVAIRMTEGIDAEAPALDARADRQLGKTDRAAPA